MVNNGSITIHKFSIFVFFETKIDFFNKFKIQSQTLIGQNDAKEKAKDLPAVIGSRSLLTRAA